MEYSAMRRETYVPVQEPPKPPLYSDQWIQQPQQQPQQLWNSWQVQAIHLKGLLDQWTTAKTEARDTFLKDTNVVQHDLKRGDNIVIHVTEEDIRDGSKGNGSDCAVVRALRRLTGYYDWYVPGDVAYLRHLNIGIKIPAKAKLFIYDWDRSAHDPTVVLEPFSFEATLVPLGHLGLVASEAFVHSMDKIFYSPPLDVEVPVPF